MFGLTQQKCNHVLKYVLLGILAAQTCAMRLQVLGAAASSASAEAGVLSARGRTGLLKHTKI